MAGKELVCDICGHDVLIGGLTMGKWDGVMNVGGPGQAPGMLPGQRWSVYICSNCGFTGPWKKYYTANPTLNAAYKAILDECRAVYKEKSVIDLKAQFDKLKTLMDAEKVLSRSLPGPGIDDGMDRIVTPLLNKIQALEERVGDLEQELKRRKGGRPRKD